MSTFLTHAWLLDRYGPRLGLAALGQVMDMTPGAVSNAISAGRFPIATYVESNGRRYADSGAVAAHLAAMAEAAKAPA